MTRRKQIDTSPADTSKHRLSDGAYQLATNGRGLEIHGKIQFGEWEHLLTSFSAKLDQTNWILGDLMAYGALNYNPDKYRIVIEKTGRKYSTVHKWGNVASKIPIEERRFNVSFSHYSNAAFIPKLERDQILEKAEINNWTSADVRVEVEALSRTIDIDAEIAPTAQPSVVIGQQFESYVAELLERIYPDHAWEHLGALKHSERGLDFVGRSIGTIGSPSVIGVQVKCHAERQTPSDLEWKAFLAGCFTRRVTQALFITTGRLTGNQHREISESGVITVLGSKEILKIAQKHELPLFSLAEK